MPKKRLDAFRLVRLVPGPKNPREVEKPKTDTPTPKITCVPLSIIELFPKESSSKNFANLFVMPPIAVIIPV